jgi:hypothetical protein
MKKTFLVFVFLSCTQIFAQLDVSASMGLDFKSSPTFKDYINMNFAKGNDQLASFKSAVAFTTEADYKLGNNFALGLEYNLQIDSYNTAVGSGGIYEISYSLHRPTLIAFYILPGQGYQFKFGGGLGYRYASLKEKIYTSTDYSASGLGVIVKAEANTLLSKNLFALIGGNFRYDFLGDVSDGTHKIINNSTGENLNLSSISFGIYLGLTFTF